MPGLPQSARDAGHHAGTLPKPDVGLVAAQVLKGQSQALSAEPLAQALPASASQRQQATAGQLRRVREALSAHVQAVCSTQQKLSSLEEAAITALDAF